MRTIKPRRSASANSPSRKNSGSGSGSARASATASKSTGKPSKVEAKNKEKATSTKKKESKPSTPPAGSRKTQTSASARSKKTIQQEEKKKKRRDLSVKRANGDLPDKHVADKEIENLMEVTGDKRDDLDFTGDKKPKAEALVEKEESADAEGGLASAAKKSKGTGEKEKETPKTAHGLVSASVTKTGGEKKEINKILGGSSEDDSGSAKSPRVVEPSRRKNNNSASGRKSRDDERSASRTRDLREAMERGRVMRDLQVAVAQIHAVAQKGDGSHNPPHSVSLMALAKVITANSANARTKLGDEKSVTLEKDIANIANATEKNSASAKVNNPTHFDDDGSHDTSGNDSDDSSDSIPSSHRSEESVHESDVDFVNLDGDRDHDDDGSYDVDAGARSSGSSDDSSSVGQVCGDELDLLIQNYTEAETNRMASIWEAGEDSMAPDTLYQLGDTIIPQSTYQLVAHALGTSSQDLVALNEQIIPLVQQNSKAMGCNITQAKKKGEELIRLLIPHGDNYKSDAMCKSLHFAIVALAIRVLIGCGGELKNSIESFVKKSQGNNMIDQMVFISVSRVIWDVMRKNDQEDIWFGHFLVKNLRGKAKVTVNEMMLISINTVPNWYEFQSLQLPYIFKSYKTRSKVVKSIWLEENMAKWVREVFETGLKSTPLRSTKTSKKPPCDASHTLMKAQTPPPKIQRSITDFSAGSTSNATSANAMIESSTSETHPSAITTTAASANESKKKRTKHADPHVPKGIPPPTTAARKPGVTKKRKPDPTPVDDAKKIKRTGTSVPERKPAPKPEKIQKTLGFGGNDTNYITGRNVIIHELCELEQYRGCHARILDVHMGTNLVTYTVKVKDDKISLRGHEMRLI